MTPPLGERMSEAIEEPPSCKNDLDTRSGIVPTYRFVVRRLQDIWRLLKSDWSICPIRNVIPSGRRIILENL